MNFSDTLFEQAADSYDEQIEDLSQLGTTRNKLKTQGYFITTKNIVFRSDSQAVKDFIAPFLPNTMRVDVQHAGSVLYLQLVGDNTNPTFTIADLQASLIPTAQPTNAEIRGDATFLAEYAMIVDDANNIILDLCGIIINYSAVGQKETDMVNAIVGTAPGQPLINLGVNEFIAFTDVQRNALINFAAQLPSALTIQRYQHAIDLRIKHNTAPGGDWTKSQPMTKQLWNYVEGLRKQIQTPVLPLFVTEVCTTSYFWKNATPTLRVAVTDSGQAAGEHRVADYNGFTGQGDDSGYAPSNIGHNVGPFNRAQAFKWHDMFTFFTAWIQRGAGQDKYEFACIRTVLGRNNFIFDSTEVISQRFATHFMNIDDQMLQAYKTFRTSQNSMQWMAYIATSLISFLKSGHHSTALRIENVAVKICASLGVTVTEIDIAQKKNTILYDALHPGSIRVIFGYFKHKSYTGQLIYAITKRIFTPPPGLTSYVILNNFLNMLDDTGFFKYLSIEDIGQAWKAPMQRILTDLHRQAPYTTYMYGLAQVNHEADQMYIEKYFSYASTWADVQPGNTISQSISFDNKVKSVSNLNILQGLQVQSMVNALRRNNTQIVQKKLTSTSGVAIKND